MFKVGDRVRIQSIPPIDKYKGPYWNGSMDCFCGLEGTIEAVSEKYWCTICFDFTDFPGYTNYTWDFKWLEPAGPRKIKISFR